MNQFIRLIILLVSLLNVGSGQKLLMNDTVCVSDSGTIAQRIREPIHHVVAGCAVPGGPPVLTWEVRIEGVVTDSAELYLTFPAGTTPAVAVEPPAIDLLAPLGYVLLCGQHPMTSQFVDCSSVSSVEITGIPEGTTGRLEVGLPTILAGRSVSSGSIAISQSPCGPYEELDFYGYRLLRCDPILPGIPQRSISLAGIQTTPPANEPAVALSSGASGDTYRESLSHTNLPAPGSVPGGSITVPRLESTDCCEPDQTIFSRDRAPWFAPRSYWASWAKNDFTARLAPSRTLPVHIWVFRNDPPLAGFDTSGTWTSPANASLLTCDFLAKCTGPTCCNNGQPGCLDMCEQAEEANRLLSTNLAGVRLDYVIHHEPSVAGPNGCGSDIATNYSQWYGEDALNVYYANPIFGNENCSNDRQVIFLSDNGKDFSVLAHEIGHALGLSPDEEGGHADRVDPGADLFHQGFGSDNVMWQAESYVISREKYSLGQIFRMHTHCTSLLHKLSPRQKAPWWNWLGFILPSYFEVRSDTDVVEPCYPRDRHSTCPDIRFDVAKP